MTTIPASAIRACSRSLVRWTAASGAPNVAARRSRWGGANRPPRASAAGGEQPETRTDEEAAEAADRAAFERMTVAELKDLLRARGQRVGGKKADLVERARAPGDDRGMTASSRSPTRAPASTSASKRKPPNPKPPPRMRWDVTDPPLPPRAPRLDRALHPSKLTVLSWNVNSIRALLDKDPDILDEVAASEDADVVLLQETKLQEKHVPEMDARVLAEYPYRTWNCSTSRLGYSGTAMFLRRQPTRAPWHDPFEMDEFEGEGRVVCAELPNVFVVGAYCPNSGEGLARLRARTKEWDPRMSAYLSSLQASAGGKPVVYCGDLNVANEPIDLWGNHAANSLASGYTPQERDSFKRLLLGPIRDGGAGLVDTFREAHGTEAKAFTYFSYRAGARPRNRGWRIDYALVSESLRGEVHDAFIRGDVGGSDHCPIGVVVKLRE